MKGTFSLRLLLLLLFEFLSFSQFAFHCFGVFVCCCVAVYECPRQTKSHLSSVNYRTIRVEFCNLFSVSVGCNKCSYLIVGQCLLLVLLVCFFFFFFCFCFIPIIEYFIQLYINIFFYYAPLSVTSSATAVWVVATRKINCT